MFSQDETEAYKKITVSPLLKGKILEAHRRQAAPNRFRYPWRRILAAASLPVILSVAALTYSLWSQDAIDVSMSGRGLMSTGLDISELPAQASSGRSLGSMDLAFDLDSRHLLAAHVSDGVLMTLDPGSSEIKEQGSSIEARGKTRLIWSLDPDRSEEYTLQLIGRRSSMTISLAYDTEADSWFIREDSGTQTP